MNRIISLSLSLCLVYTILSISSVTTNATSRTPSPIVVGKAVADTPEAAKAALQKRVPRKKQPPRRREFEQSHPQPQDPPSSPPSGQPFRRSHTKKKQPPRSASTSSESTVVPVHTSPNPTRKTPSPFRSSSPGGDSANGGVSPSILAELSRSEKRTSAFTTPQRRLSSIPTAPTPRKPHRGSGPPPAPPVPPASASSRHLPGSGLEAPTISTSGHSHPRPGNLSGGFHPPPTSQPLRDGLGSTTSYPAPRRSTHGSSTPPVPSFPEPSSPVPSPSSGGELWLQGVQNSRLVVSKETWKEMKAVLAKLAYLPPANLPSDDILQAEMGKYLQSGLLTRSAGILGSISPVPEGLDNMATGLRLSASIERVAHQLPVAIPTDDMPGFLNMLPVMFADEDALLRSGDQTLKELVAHIANFSDEDLDEFVKGQISPRYQSLVEENAAAEELLGGISDAAVPAPSETWMSIGRNPTQGDTVAVADLAQQPRLLVSPLQEGKLAITPGEQGFLHNQGPRAFRPIQGTDSQPIPAYYNGVLGEWTRLMSDDVGDGMQHWQTLPGTGSYDFYTKTDQPIATYPSGLDPKTRGNIMNLFYGNNVGRSTTGPSSPYVPKSIVYDPSDAQLAFAPYTPSQ